ncbi:hypothetical protein EXIGLDRAFT_841759 [Exidia glandulosa HHB12029]|uniref:Conidiation protein 6 n=1 Tax=Exidia glandulosa HHB12029 TaxID=1314781 RepID=A0A165ZQN4_EXIGL|nr:hypothetical protein EXIGLDRAFT_841759 [Exidia glandulosa HHB12029]
MSGANPGNIAGGHKANLKNPNTSEESKDHSRQVLESMEDGTFENSVEPHKPLSNEEAPVKETNRVLGGYKATLKNESASQEKKDHAREVLADHGIDA